MYTTYHVYSVNCFESSRVMLQSSWDIKSIFVHDIRATSFDHKTNKVDEKKYSLTTAISILFNYDKKKKIVYHSQSSLPFLLVSYVIVKIARLSNICLVYDIHDLIEKLEPSLSWYYFRYGILRYQILKVIESYIVSKDEIKIITVSNGLSKVITKRYNCSKPQVVYSAIKPKYSASYLYSKKRNDIAILYFGSEDRLPTALIEIICNSGFKLHLYGRDFSHGNMNFNNKFLKKDCIKIHGKYSPENLEFLLKYKYMILYKPENKSDNFKYSLPNKLFQSVCHGVSLIISPNFREMKLLFSDIRGAVNVIESDSNINDLLKQIDDNRSELMFENLNGILDELNLKSMKVYQALN